jgi:voltage-gated potassium channel
MQRRDNGGEVGPGGTVGLVESSRGSDDATATRPAARATALRAAAGTATLLLAVTVLFVALPWTRMDLAEGPVVILVFLVGLALTTTMVFHQAMSYRRAASSGDARLRGLLVWVYIAVLFFATAFYLLERAEPGQFDGLVTRLDAAYFALAILSTVGFGDVHAVGQAARAMVCAQIVFDVIVISLAVDAVRHSRAQSRARTEVAGSESQRS